MTVRSFPSKVRSFPARVRSFPAKVRSIPAGVHSIPAKVHCVVVGSGIAGLTVALHAVESGCRVTLVTKDELEHANTRYAQGGIAGVMFADDRVEDHIRDTLVAGAGLADEAAVRILAEEGPARIRELIKLGVSFDRTPDGAFVKGLEAAHSYPRILHCGGDATGTAIEKALVERLRASEVTVIEHAFLVGLALDRPADEQAEGGETRGAPRVVGVDLLLENQRHTTIRSDAVVLATGGAGQLYAHTTNPIVATGDGIAAAIRAGADVRDLEFFQFHPTVLQGRPDTTGLAAGEPFLVSEAVRGEGATLVDENGHRFTLRAHPAGELAPRDVVARAIAERMVEQDGRPVHLDATVLRPTEDQRRSFLARRFPTIDAAVRARGLDWARQPIPVTPAAHYLMGGIVTDHHGRSSIPGLYAVGEAACTGVHGANRLASNSLLEGAVFGARAGDVVAADAVSGMWPARHRDTASSMGGPAAAGVAGEMRRLDVAPFTREALQELMWTDAGLVRDAEGLQRAASILFSWRNEERTPETEREFEDENLLLVAERLVAAALARAESVGAHFRADDPSAMHPHGKGAHAHRKGTHPHEERTHPRAEGAHPRGEGAHPRGGLEREAVPC